MKFISGKYRLNVSARENKSRTMGQINEKHRWNSHLIIHFSTSEGVSEASKRMSATQAKQAGRSQQMSEQYLRLDSWLYWTIVHFSKNLREITNFSNLFLSQIQRRKL